ncbi:MAG: thiamine phosphate synthase [Candidatus Tyrphobacter sp.]
MTRAQRACLLHGIYVIVNESPRAEQIARAAVDAGIRILQYRAKRGIDPRHLRALRALADERDALLLVDDDWRAALALRCDGVHLGPGDDGFDDLARVRSALGELLLGVSCADASEMRAAEAGGADYAGVGSVFSTASKSDAGTPIGIPGLCGIAAAARLPVAAIGGITAENLRDVKASGVAMAATISAIADAADPARAAREMLRIWNDAEVP